RRSTTVTVAAGDPMIVTRDFVYIHYPKTGGTFVTAMIGALYPAKQSLPSPVEDFLRRAVRGPWPHDIPVAGRAYRRLLGHVDLKKHGACFEIPRVFSDLPIG